MTSISKRIEELRTAKGLSQLQLSAALGFPKTAVEKFEAGRMTPSNAQKEKMAAFFGVPVDYLTGESDETLTMNTWLADTQPAAPRKPVPVKKARPAAVETTGTVSTNIFESLLKSDDFKKAVLEVLKSPEGRELLKKYGSR